MIRPFSLHASRTSLWQFSTMIPVDARLEPIDDYYLWCGGIYSSEWGFAKLLHWLRHNPEKRGPFTFISVSRYSTVYE
jgi:hypothetical protein